VGISSVLTGEALQLVKSVNKFSLANSNTFHMGTARVSLHGKQPSLARMILHLLLGFLWDFHKVVNQIPTFCFTSDCIFNDRIGEDSIWTSCCYIVVAADTAITLHI